MKIPKAINNLIESFESLPGIGPKSAQRLTFYLLHVPQHQLDQFANNLSNLKKGTVLCSVCKNVGEADPCQFCGDINRDKNIIVVVEQPLDILAIERSGKFAGVYHVLHGSINPLDNIGPDELYISDLLERVKDSDNVSEVILATNPTMEGEATAMYLKDKIRGLNEKVIVSRLGMGIPTGAYLEFADETTITQALEGRREL
jgi:recombination protein RecR